MKICTACRVPHYTDCLTCFGYGIFVEGHRKLPTTSYQAGKARMIDPLPEGFKPCPECKSTIRGVPNESERIET